MVMNESLIDIATSQPEFLLTEVGKLWMSTSRTESLYEILQTFNIDNVEFVGKSSTNY